MKKTLRFAAVVSSLAAASAARRRAGRGAGARFAGAQLADEVVAVVNNDVITGRELDQRAGLIARRLQQQNAPVPPTDQLRAQVLNQMVLERIQVQKAKDDGIRIDDATVQATLQRLAQANGMTLEQYRARLEAQGVPWSIFTSDARTELMLSKLREREVDGKITVSDAGSRTTSRASAGRVRRNSRTCASSTSSSRRRPTRRRPTSKPRRRRLTRCCSRRSRAPTSRSSRRTIRKRTTRRRAATSASRRRARCRPTSSTPHRSCARVNPTLIRVPDGFEIVRLVDRRQSRRASAAAPKIVQTHVRHILLRVGEGKSEGQAPATGRHPQRSRPAAISRSSRVPTRRTVRRRKAAISAGSARARPCRNSNAR